jgi:hypothetical protein
MIEQNTGNAGSRALFAELVMMLSTSAMQQLGKLVNPATGKAELNLEAAQFSIDMLDMLKEKTRGNLDREEESMLAGVLSSLQMNFVEAARTPPPPQESPAAPEAPADGPPDGKAAPPPPPEGKERKYHKSYG